MKVGCWLALNKRGASRQVFRRKRTNFVSFGNKLQNTLHVHLTSRVDNIGYSTQIISTGDYVVNCYVGAGQNFAILIPVNDNILSN